VLSPEARAFLRASIRSVWALEALKCLRSEPTRQWTAAALSAELRASELAIQQALTAFRSAGLVSDESDIRYQPATSALDALAGEILSEFERRPVALIKEMYILETSRIQDFADAFRLKKDDT
jgi:hypothetical protein